MNGGEGFPYSSCGWLDWGERAGKYAEYELAESGCPVEMGCGTRPEFARELQTVPLEPE